jgi:hypothetical protein
VQRLVQVVSAVVGKHNDGGVGQGAWPAAAALRMVAAMRCAIQLRADGFGAATTCHRGGMLT